MLFFMKERYASGDLKGVGDLKTVNAVLMNEWKALNAGEKKVCFGVFDSDRSWLIFGL